MERHSAPGVRRLHLVNRAPFPRLIDRGHCSPSPDSSSGATGLCPVLSGLCAETDKLNLKLVCKFKGLRTGNKTVLKMKNESGGIRLPDFKACY